MLIEVGPSEFSGDVGSINVSGGSGGLLTPPFSIRTLRAGTVPPASSPSMSSPSQRAWCFWVSVCLAFWVALGACGSKEEQLRLTKHQTGQLNQRRKMEERPIRQPVVLAFDEVADQRQVSVIQPDT